jgi:citrate lyase alpha subunit
LQEYFKSLKVGDIVYIKAAFAGADITVKAIGIIKDNIVRVADDTSDLVTTGRNVEWLCTEKFIIPRPQEKNNVRSNTVYEEFHPEVQKIIIDKIT